LRDGSTLDGAWDQADITMSATIVVEDPKTRITLASYHSKWRLTAKEVDMALRPVVPQQETS